MITIYAITTSRGDFDLLSNLLIKLKKNKNFNLELVLSGSLTSKKFGDLSSYIKENKLRVKKKIFLNLKKDNHDVINCNFAKSINDFNNLLKKNKPDLVLLLGDRYEVFALAIAAFIRNIKIAHIHGGEDTLGAQDNAFRNSISQMAYIHFVSHPQAQKKLKKMGIKKNVYYVGGLGAYNASKIKIIKSKKKLSKVIKFNFLKKNFLITFNPVTLEKDAGLNCLNNLIFVLKKYNQFGLIFTISNIDFNFNKFNSKIYNFCKNLTNAKVFKQLGKKNYFSTMSNVDLVIGNSSSGLLEAPSFNIPTINIGSRQDGRIKAKSVIDTDCSKKGIEKAIQIGLTKKYNKISKKTYNPYYKYNTVENIILILKKTNFNKIL